MKNVLEAANSSINNGSYIVVYTAERPGPMMLGLKRIVILIFEYSLVFK